MNTAPARSVIKKKGARPGSQGPVQDRARPSAHVILAWVSKPGTPNLAWGYKTSAQKEYKHPTLNTAPARSVIKKKGARPGSLGPVQDRARPSAHVILAWVY